MNSRCQAAACDRDCAALVNVVRHAKDRVVIIVVVLANEGFRSMRTFWGYESYC